MRKLFTFLRLPVRQQLLAAEAALALAAGWAAISKLPPHRLRPLYGEVMAETPSRLPTPAEQTAHNIGRTLRMVKRNLPWHSTCHMDAVAAKLMLNRRGIPSTMYVTITPQPENPEEPITGHTWVRSGRWYVAGQPGGARLVNTFATPSK